MDSVTARKKISWMSRYVMLLCHLHAVICGTAELIREKKFQLRRVFKLVSNFYLWFSIYVMVAKIWKLLNIDRTYCNFWHYKLLDAKSEMCPHCCKMSGGVSCKLKECTDPKICPQPGSLNSEISTSFLADGLSGIPNTGSLNINLL